MPRKSPFVSGNETYTYTYPQPLDPDDADEVKLIDPEVADDPDKPWIKVRIPRSAEDVDAVADYTQSVVSLATANGNGGALESRIKRANRGLFDLLMEQWSFSKGKPSGTDYDRLAQWAAVWIRTALGDATSKGTTPDFRESTKSSSTTAPTSPVDSEPVSSSES